ncbi:hypothetical protein OAT93_02060 [bacterium]|nr:hypothetical protein [bacterium]
MVETGSIRLEKNRPGSVQGKCCQKLTENFCLTLFWYSPTYRNLTINFAIKYEVSISLIYYPPYHSKYNPVERAWGVLENYWKGQLLDKAEKVIGLARTMTYNGINPVVKFINQTYEKGVKLTKNTM